MRSIFDCVFVFFGFLIVWGRYLIVDFSVDKLKILEMGFEFWYVGCKMGFVGWGVCL